MTVFNATNGLNDSDLILLLARSAAPFHFIHRDGEFSLWICPVIDKEPRPRVEEPHIPYDQLESILRKYEADLRPQRIIDVKQGYSMFTHFREVQPLQLSLWAAEVNGKRLVEHFGNMVVSLREDIGQRRDIPKEEKDPLVTTLSTQLLGATILADTGVLGEDMRRNRPSLDKLLSRAAEKFERYFKRDVFIKYSFEARSAYDILQKICFANFVPDMLSELYKTAYSRQERKESGSYDTPLYLTRHIWKNIPIEYFPPQKRIVADMTCGWGSFLVAGHERLSGQKDMDGIALRNHLYGNDSMNFTSQLAGLGLLLATSEDSWNIDQNNATEWQWLKTHQPMVIVGNPPFEADRRKTNSSDNKRRNEKANQFLKHAIDRLAPGGDYKELLQDADGHQDQEKSPSSEHPKRLRRTVLENLMDWYVEDKRRYVAPNVQPGIYEDAIEKALPLSVKGIKGELANHIYLLHPYDTDLPNLELKGLNNTSVVLQIISSGSSALLTGDLEPHGWYMLQKNYPNLQCDILKFPHHGGAWNVKDTKALLDSVQPSIVVISVGTDGEKYKHPNEEVFCVLSSPQYSHIRVLCTQATNQCQSLL